MAGRAVAEFSGARDEKKLTSQLTAQARSLRQELSGVSLDKEAIVMVEFQRAHQAAARMASVLNELTETVVNLYR